MSNNAELLTAFAVAYQNHTVTKFGLPPLDLWAAEKAIEAYEAAKSAEQPDERRATFEKWAKSNLDPKTPDLTWAWLWESFEAGWNARPMRESGVAVDALTDAIENTKIRLQGGFILCAVILK